MNASERIGNLRAVLVADDLPALVVSDPSNIRYLCGFTGSAGTLVVSASGSTALITDGRYQEQARAEVDDSASGSEAIQVIVSRNTPEALAEALGAERQIAVEADQISLATAASLEGSEYRFELIATRGLVAGLRAVKDDDEIECLATAVAIADTSLAATLADAGPEMTEDEFGLALEVQMRRRGATGNSFAPIVAAGPNAALPHARPEHTPLGQRRPVVIDFGCRVDGYCSDTTRTVSFGEPEAEIAKIFDIVAEAQDAARSAVRDGAECVAVDAAARDVIADAGYGEHFVHATGHGIGLDVHEALRLSESSADRLETGNVVTIEPGIYLPGKGGVRLEDMVVVEPEGCRTLQTAPRRLAI